MPFCACSKELSVNGFTVVDNIFVTQYMPDAPQHCVELYLFGLFLCNNQTVDNTIDTMCEKLNMTKEDVKAGFTYWEELGLVHILGEEEIEVTYLPIRTDRNLLKKIKASKYREFSQQMQNVLDQRMITTNEYNEYFMFLETSFFEPSALVSVTRYCADLKGKSISYGYILTVARNLSTSGINTRERVEEKLQEHPKYNQDLALIFKALKISHKIEYYDREYYQRWTKDYGFNLDTLMQIAKNCKGGMVKLNALCEEYYKQKLLSIKEIEDYNISKEKFTNLAIEINKQIGVYYQLLDGVVAEYIIPWSNKGYDEETLKLIAKYCFRNNVRTLQGMDSVVERFYKLGLLTCQSINQHIEQVLARDIEIKNILNSLNLVRNVSNTDRNFYKTWTNEWGIEDELILATCELCQTANNPTLYLNKILADYHLQGILTTKQLSKANFGNTASKVVATDAKFATYPQREYSEEEIRALFDTLKED
ncbi:MAG: DnaD domain protein [Clostridia bacterium]